MLVTHGPEHNETKKNLADLLKQEYLLGLATLEESRRTSDEQDESKFTDKEKKG